MDLSSILNLPTASELAVMLALGLRLVAYVLLFALPVGLVLGRKRLQSAVPYVLFAALAWHYVLHHAQSVVAVRTEFSRVEVHSE